MNNFLRITSVVDGKEKFIGDTDFAMSNNNPVYRRGIRFEVVTGKKQYMKIQCWDQEDPIGGRPTLPTVGEASPELAYLLKFQEGAEVPIWMGERQTGTITVRYRRILQAKNTFKFHLSCRDVKNVEFFSKTDPFVRILRPTEEYIHHTNPREIDTANWIKVFETEHIKNTLNPAYTPFELPWWELCAGHPDALIKFQIWDDNIFGLYERVGNGYTTFSNIIAGQRNIDCKDDDHYYVGTVVIDKIEELKIMGYADMLDKGVTFRPIVFMDCSASCAWAHAEKESAAGADGKPTFKATESLMEKVLKDLQLAFEQYYKTTRFALIGFGAKVRNTKVPVFAFNMNENNPGIANAQEAITYYRKMLPNLIMEEPTSMDPVIEKGQLMSAHVTKAMPNIYSMLVVLTDGDVGDRERLIENIVECSTMPISICFVGLSKDNKNSEAFNFLTYLDTGKRVGQVKDQLDGDRQDTLQDRNGKFASRDCTTFAKYDAKTKSDAFAKDLFRNVIKEMGEYYSNRATRAVPPQPPQPQQTPSQPTVPAPTTSAPATNAPTAGAPTTNPPAQATVPKPAAPQNPAQPAPAAPVQPAPTSVPTQQSQPAVKPPQQTPLPAQPQSFPQPQPTQPQQQLPIKQVPQQAPITQTPVPQQLQQPVQPKPQPPVQPPVQQPVQQPIQQPVQQPIQQPIQRPVQQPIQPPMQQQVFQQPPPPQLQQPIQPMQPPQQQPLFQPPQPQYNNRPSVESFPLEQPIFEPIQRYVQDLSTDSFPLDQAIFEPMHNYIDDFHPDQFPLDQPIFEPIQRYIQDFPQQGGQMMQGQPQFMNSQQLPPQQQGQQGQFVSQQQQLAPQQQQYFNAGQQIPGQNPAGK